MGKFTSIAKTFLSGGLSTLTIFVTDKCNARCSICFNWRSVENREQVKLLSVEEYSKIAENIGHLPSLIVSGGEPFLRKDLDQIIDAFYRFSGARHISIPTNAMLKNIDQHVQEIIDGKPDLLLRILVSVDGLYEDHEKQRGMKSGSFALLEDNVEKLVNLSAKYKNLSINACTVFHQGNRNLIGEVIEWVHSKGFYEHKFQILRGDFKDRTLALADIQGYQEMNSRANELFFERNPDFRTKGIYEGVFSAVSKYSRSLAAKRKETNKPVVPCLVGKRILVIKENGDVFPCEMLDKPLGNVRTCDYKITDLRKGKEYRQLRRHIKKSECSCSAECYAVIDTVYNMRTWPGVLKEYLFGKKGAGKS